MKIWRRHLRVNVAKVLVLALIGLAAGCSKGGAQNGAVASAAPEAAMPPVPVLTARAELKTVPVDLESIGSVQASSTVDVKSMIAGQIVKVHFTRGQEVKAGGALFSIDARPYDAALAEARASQDVAQAQVTQARADTARDEAQLRNAEREEQRLAKLLKQKVVAQDEYDTQQTQAETLRATVQADQAAADAALQSVKAAQAAVQQAEVNLSYCTIKAPIEGRTGDLLIHEGSWVKANDVPLVVINRMQPVLVSFTVPEQFLQGIRKAMGERKLSVRAVPPNAPDGSVTGELIFIDNTVDPQTSKVTLLATFDNPAEQLWPGQFVETHLTLQEIKDAVVVPSQAIEVGQNGDYVFVVGSDQTVTLRPVTPGQESGGLTVIESGLKAGEVVVTDGQMRLSAGARIVLKSSIGEAPGQEQGQ